MIAAGMNIARLNFSHGDFASHRRAIENLRAASAVVGRSIAIMADLSGPKIRIGEVSPEPIELVPGQAFKLTTEAIIGDRSRASVSFGGLPQAVKPGDILFLNDGNIQLEAVGVKAAEVTCIVRVGGELRSRKGLNLPGIDLGIAAFTECDYECLKFALENGVDAISQSFVEKASDIEAVQKAATDLGYRPFIIAKIERSRALEHKDEIIDAADGIMVARGDLGVEVPIEQIALVQKDLIRSALIKGKPVITATQMLESMTNNRRPTRAEATDVANAILDGTDCVMLSGESAMGLYPVESVEMLVKIASTVESSRHRLTVRELFQGIGHQDKVLPAHLIAIGVEASLEYVSPAAVFIPTLSGATARNIARSRLPVWIIAISSHRTTCQTLQFSSGVFPVLEREPPEDWNTYVRAWIQEHELRGDLVILTEGPSLNHPEANHRMEIIDLKR